MIKAITSVPVVRKALTGTMLVASLLGGAASCSRPAKTSGETNVSYTQIMEKDGTDVFESGAKNSKAVPVNKKEIDQVSFECNKYKGNNLYIIDSTNYKNYGLYYGSILEQTLWDRGAAGSVSLPLYQEANKLPDAQLLEEHRRLKKCYDKPLMEAYDAYRDELLAKYSRNLYENKDGVPTAKECSDYLDRTLAGIDISTEDYDKCLKKIENFKNAQGEQGNHEFAEYLAYKQFIIDSVNTRHILQDLGFLKDHRMKHMFERDVYSDISPKPYMEQD